MSEHSDSEDVLRRFVSDHHAERLLAGARVDAGEELADVAALLALLREPAREEELAAGEVLLARMLDAARVDAAPTDVAGAAAPSRRKPMLTRLITGKVAAIAAVTFVSAGAAAAATGNLPDPVQRGVSRAVSHVGIDLPAPADRPRLPLVDESTGSVDPTVVPTTDASASTTITPTTDVSSTTGSTTTIATTPTTTPATAVPAPLPPSAATSTTVEDDERIDGATTPVGPDASGPAATGLCTAYAAGGDHGKRLESVAMRNLAAAAEEAGQTVEEYCATVLGDAEGEDEREVEAEGADESVATVAPPASDQGERPSATAPGQSGERPGNGNGRGNGRGDDPGNDRGNDRGEGRGGVRNGNGSQP